MRHATGTVLSILNRKSDDWTQLPDRRGCCFRSGRSIGRWHVPFRDAVRRVVPIDIVGIEPQTDAGEGVVLQVEVTNRESLGNCGCRVVRTVTCLVGSDRSGSGGTNLNGFSIALYLSHQDCRNW